MGGVTPKPYLNLVDRPILAHTLQLFQNMKAIKDIYLVVKDDDRLWVEREVINAYSFNKVREVIAGGKERQDSVYNAIKRIPPEDEMVIIHDGVRPLVDKETVIKTLDAARQTGAAIAAVPVKDTIKKVNEQGLVEETLDRTQIHLVQTPQAFYRELILQAYEKAFKDNLYGTDDALLVERLGTPIKVVMGNYENVKITTPEDMLYAETILRARGR